MAGMRTSITSCYRRASGSSTDKIDTSVSRMHSLRYVRPGSLLAHRVSLLLQEQWGRLPVLNCLESRLESRAGKRQLPYFLSSCERGELRGVGGIFDDDMPELPEFNPWLGCVYVRPEYRHRGLAHSIVSSLATHADQIHIERLFLFCEPRLTSLYARFGWIPIQAREYEGMLIVIMKRERVSEWLPRSWGGG
jgi:N-acetylglutamate synthase-like GNAT family acetyltransferase